MLAGFLRSLRGHYLVARAVGAAYHDVHVLGIAGEGVAAGVFDELSELAVEAVGHLAALCGGGTVGVFGELAVADEIKVDVAADDVTVGVAHGHALAVGGHVTVHAALGGGGAVEGEAHGVAVVVAVEHFQTVVVAVAVIVGNDHVVVVAEAEIAGAVGVLAEVGGRNGAIRVELVLAGVDVELT